MTTAYADTYLSGPPEVIEAVLALNAGAPAVTPLRVLDGVAHVAIRLPVGVALALPPAVLLADLTATPETAQMAAGVFMPDPAEA